MAFRVWMILWLFAICHIEASESFNTYFALKNDSQVQSEQHFYDCLPYYRQRNAEISSKEQNMRIHQTHLYCFRPLVLPENNASHSKKVSHVSWTFEQLKLKGITSNQLHLWSAPIDLAESYQFYLETSVLPPESFFYNCTLPWFGPLCQYSFDWLGESGSFVDLVDQVFQMKTSSVYSSLGPSIILSNLSCYEHLSCNRGGEFPACLDWREVCDGDVQCIDGGIDESYCDELEANECNENEYRCHNGQCIFEGYFHDDERNPDCLDGSDELLENSEYRTCASDPTYRCEDRVCLSIDFRGEISCGDGECFPSGCMNKRDRLLQQAMATVPINISRECHEAMSCRSGLQDCYSQANLTNICPPLFRYPGVPVLHGHVNFFYANTEPTKNPSWNLVLLPAFFCFDQRLCFFERTESIENYATCLRYDAPALRQIRETRWGLLRHSLASIFGYCSTVVGGYCHHKNLFSCNSSKPKCISKHRVLDGFADCFGRVDEAYQESCSLYNSKFRFRCKDKCWSPVVQWDRTSNCEDDYDEMDAISIYMRTVISFQTMCDGFPELDPIAIDGRNYTDESECQLWPCNNTYTRCDGIWNCPRGEDEVNCISSHCRSTEHVCVSPVNNSLTCVSLDQVRDSKIDCLGALDEPQLCLGDNSYIKPLFLCEDPLSLCIEGENLCNGRRECVFGDDERFCESEYELCAAGEKIENDLERVMCKLFKNIKKSIVHLSLRDTIEYPSVSDLSPTQPTLTSTQPSHSTGRATKATFQMRDETSISLAWRCNRGLIVRVALGNASFENRCLCPPSYYGNLCEYQNQRVSIILQVRALAEFRTLFTLVLVLIDDEQSIINSFEQIEYLPVQDCSAKFYVNLLYSTRPKQAMRNYSVRVDAYKKLSLQYRTSWLYPIRFAFLPVHRLALQIKIPMYRESLCSKDCGLHGRCSNYQNSELLFCHCQPGWSGAQCKEQYNYNCAPQSLSIGPSMCLCPPGRFGARCYLLQPSSPRENNSRTTDDDGTTIIAQLADVSWTQHVLIQLVEVFDRGVLDGVETYPSPEIKGAVRGRMHVQTSSVIKIGLYQKFISLLRETPFHLIFTQFDQKLYLAVARKTFVSSTVIETKIDSTRRCLFIDELFNASIRELHPLRRLKYYHLPCGDRPNLVCFYDESYMCLCNSLRHANCFKFDSNMTNDCGEMNHCENAARCILDDRRCPSSSVCICSECFYGSRCQLSSKGIGISLDALLGYHILPKMSLTSQPFVIKLSTWLTMIMFFLGLISSVASILTFHDRRVRQVGCGTYLLASSMMSLCAMSIFAIKFWMLVLSQMGSINSISYLRFNCKSMNFLLRLFLNASDWLNACVAIERAVMVFEGPTFNKVKSKRVMKWAIISTFLLTTMSLLPDLIYHKLINDEEDQRLWCISEYPMFIQRYNMALNYIHFLSPFAINLISALVIILMTARRRSAIVQKLSYKQYLREQFREHQHLLISPLMLVILAFPRLIIASLSGCVKPYRDPRLFLAGYFISFVPPMLIFPIFVLPSSSYRQAFLKVIRHGRR